MFTKMLNGKGEKFMYMCLDLTNSIDRFEVSSSKTILVYRNNIRFSLDLDKDGVEAWITKFYTLDTSLLNA